MFTPFLHTQFPNTYEIRATQSCLVALLFLTMSAFAGCAEDSPPTLPVLPPLLSHARTSEAEIRGISHDELQALVETSERPVLVEFSVLSGCYRCDDMRSPIRQKAVDIQTHADVIRVDFNLNRSLAQEVGATVCPSYVVYSQGRVVSVRTWPTSADFVADDVMTAVSQDSTSQIAVPGLPATSSDR